MTRQIHIAERAVLVGGPGGRKVGAERQPQDGELLERLRAGDEAAFIALVQAHHASMVRLALTFVSDRGAAEEVAQDAWLGVVKGLARFEGRASLKTWIFRILVNRARSRGVSDARMVPFSAFDAEEREEQPMLDRFTARGGWARPAAAWSEQSPEEVLAKRETREAIDAAIAALPAGQRAVVTLRDIEGLDASEVCNILEISETNQRVLLHRARVKLRAAVERHVNR